MSIEDEIFSKAIEAMSMKRTKSMYQKAEYPHYCDMCSSRSDKENERGYVLKLPYVSGSDTPYFAICKDCYNSLPE